MIFNSQRVTPFGTKTYKTLVLDMNSKCCKTLGIQIFLYFQAYAYGIKLR